MASRKQAGESSIQEIGSSSVAAQLNLAQILSNIVLRPADNTMWPPATSTTDVVTVEPAYEGYGDNVNESNISPSLPEINLTDVDMLTVSNSEEIDPELECLLNEIEEMAANHNGLGTNNTNKSDSNVRSGDSEEPLVASNFSVQPPAKTLYSDDVDEFVEPKPKIIKKSGSVGSTGKGSKDIKKIYREVEAKPSTSKRNFQSPSSRKKKATDTSLLKTLLTNNCSRPATQASRNVQGSKKKNCIKTKSGQSIKKPIKSDNITRGGCSNAISRGRRSYDNICIDISNDSDSENEFQIFSQSHDRKLFEQALRRHRDVEKEVATRRGAVKEIEVAIRRDSENLQVVQEKIENINNRTKANNAKLERFEEERRHFEEEVRRIKEQILSIDEQCPIIREENNNLAGERRRFEEERRRYQETISGNRARLEREKNSVNALVKKSEFVRKKFSDY